MKQQPETELLPAENQPHFQPPPNAVATRGAQPMAVSAAPQNTVADMLKMVVERGISAADVSAFKELVQLHREEVKLNAEKEFAAAFVALQKQLPTIQGHRPVPARDGTVKYRYANFDDIDQVVRPICLEHGFTYAFRESAVDNGRVTVVMTLQHSCGAFREIPYSVRVGSGPPGATESQADVSGHSYAQRGALESGLALRVVGARDDAKMEGNLDEKISTEQAEELERRVKMTNSNVPAFLSLAGAKKFAEIPANRYAELDGLLRRKEQGR
jgi:hypothetical protein